MASRFDPCRGSIPVATGGMKPAQPRFRRRPLRRWLTLIVFCAMLVSRYFFRERELPVPEALEEGPCEVARVVDGDTLLLVNRARVRLQGVDTPEVTDPDQPPEPWGPEATEFTRAFLRRGPARMQLGPERKDQYGRFLAYVWVGDQMLNEELLRAGMARALLRFNYSDSMKRRFRRAQDEARRARRGIWSGASPDSKAE